MKAAVFCSILVGLALFGCDNRQSSGRQESGATLCDAQGVPVSFLVVYSQSNEPKTFFDRLSFGVDPASSVTTQTHHSLGLLPVPPQGTDHAEFVFCLSRLPASESLSKLAEHGFSDDFSETLKTILDKIGTIDESDGLAKAVLVGSSGNLHWSAYLYSRQKTNKYALTCHLSDRRQAYRFFKRCSRDESSELEKLYQFCAARLSLENDKSIKLEPGEIDFGEVTEIERTVLTAMLRNDGDRTVHVTDVIRTCVCAKLELSATNLPPGGAAEVRCTLDPNVFSGPFLKTFFIKTDDPATPSITVPIRGSVRQLWEVSPDKWYQMRAGYTNAILRVKAAPDAPALVRSEILGPDGASFELRPAGEREFDAVFTPGDQPRGQHHWTVNLYPEGAETPALGLHLGKQVGEHWKCVPARLRAPVNGRDFVADLLVKPANGKDLPADVDPAAITISPEWDHVAIEPLGPPTWRGIPLRLTIGAEMVSSWEFPKTFYLTVPNHGAASVYFEKIVLPSDADNR